MENNARLECLGSIPMHGPESLMAVWSKVFQWREMFCHDPEITDVNPSWT